MNSDNQDIDALPQDLVDNELYLDKIDLNERVDLRTELDHYRVIFEILHRDERQLRALYESDRTNNLPSTTQKKIKTAHKKVNKALKGVMSRFETEYSMKANEWRKEVKDL